MLCKFLKWRYSWNHTCKYINIYAEKTYLRNSVYKYRIKAAYCLKEDFHERVRNSKKRSFYAYVFLILSLISAFSFSFLHFAEELVLETELINWIGLSQITKKFSLCIFLKPYYVVYFISEYRNIWYNTESWYLRQFLGSNTKVILLKLLAVVFNLEFIWIPAC